MYPIPFLRALVRHHEIERDRSLRRALRFRKWRSHAHNTALDRLSDDADNSLQDARRFLSDALAELEDERDR